MQELQVGVEQRMPREERQDGAERQEGRKGDRNPIIPQPWPADIVSRSAPR